MSFNFNCWVEVLMNLPPLLWQMAVKKFWDSSSVCLSKISCFSLKNHAYWF